MVAHHDDRSSTLLSRGDPANWESQGTYGSHLEALRRALRLTLLWLAIGMGLGLLLADRTMQWVQGPVLRGLEVALRGQGGFVPGRLPADLADAVAAGHGRLNALLLVGIVLTIPGMFYHMWSFATAGLPPRYSRTFPQIIFGSFIFCLAAGILLLKPFVAYLASFYVWMGLDQSTSAAHCLELALIFPVAFAAAWQLPVAMLLLERTGIAAGRYFLQNWRIATLVIFVSAAVVTPADPYSLLLMAIPFVVLYFAGIAMCYVSSRMSS